MRTALKYSTIIAEYAAARNYKEPQPDPDPDGQYWIDGVKIKAEQFISLTGREEYDRWCDIVLPGNTGVNQTWKHTYQQIAAAAALLWLGKFSMNTLVRAAELVTYALERGLEPVDLAEYRDLLEIRDEDMRNN